MSAFSICKRTKENDSTGLTQPVKLLSKRACEVNVGQMSVFQGYFMISDKILILIAFSAVMVLFAIFPSNAGAEPVQPHKKVIQLFDNHGGAIPEEKPRPAVERWTGKVKIAGVVKNIDTKIASKPLVEGSKAIVHKGLAYAPINSPAAVKAVIWAGNKIRSLPYLWGGGHGSFKASGYDCSGSVSFALNGAKLVKSPMASGGYYSWGKSGPGKWITIYTNNGHMYMHIAGIRFDTSGANPSRWQSDLRPSFAYVLRHPINL